MTDTFIRGQREKDTQRPGRVKTGRDWRDSATGQAGPGLLGPEAAGVGWILPEPSA